ncbi:ATP-binding protein [Herbaspirillum autotrophicum]|uniref:ATP-binding protein n=1 Tax=Herbaspirillum autotrophicum TaxID=180195 RepID=UPI00067C28BD|nr:ATP-binding protein [Herbaspirillum autotrophicum]
MPRFTPSDATDAPAPYAFLQGPGIMGDLIRAHDWSQTPLGPLDNWPQSLRTTVSLMLNSCHPIWIGWGPEITFLYNDAYIGVLSSLKHPHALGRPTAEVWHEVWDICGPLADKVFARGEATSVEEQRLFMNREDGVRETYYSFSYSPIRDESGAVGGLFCPNTEVTAKFLHARRLRTLSELAAGALLEKTTITACAATAAVLAGNPDDIPFALLYLSDADGRHAVLEQSVHVLPAHYSAPAHIDLSTPEKYPICPVHDVLASGRAQIIDVSTLHDLPRGPANHPVRTAIALPLAASGKEQPVGVLIFGVNPTRPLDDDYRTFFELLAGQAATAIRNARSAEDEKRRADLLAELDHAKTTFFSNVSHEFRTPLTLMLGPLDDLLSEPSLDWAAPQVQQLELIRRNALRLQKLVNTLLDFSRLQANSTQPEFVAVDLAALTADIASTFRATMESAGLTFEVDCPTLTEAVFVDVGMWEKIILNLLSNAYKFTFEGSVTLTLRQRDEHVVVTVSDTGVGVAASDLPLLFKRFHRVAGARARSHEGSGIGLALVRDLLALHGGQIEVDSAPARGTRFTLHLPLGHAHVPAAAVVAATDISMPAALPVSTADGTLAASYVGEAERWNSMQEPVVAAATELMAATSTRHMRVLVADDNADMRDYLRNLLSPRWQVLTAANGVQALAAVREQAPDLIVSDVMMPELDGFGLLAAVRAEMSDHNLPFILLSARAGEEARLDGLLAGADEYMVKPFSGRELVARIEAMLLRSQLRQVEQRHAARMATVFAQAPVGIAITRGAEHVFELANSHYCDLVGRQSLVGKTVKDAMPELAGQCIFALLDEVYREGKPHIGRSLRVELQQPDGTLRVCYFDFVYQPMFDTGGQPEGIAVVAFDVSELTRARQNAEVANRTKDEFIAILGHELRNPLTPIMTAVQLMRLRGNAGTERECNIIERQARHLVRLVDDLLDVSRVAQGKIVLKKHVLEIAEIVAKAVETASPLLEERQHRLNISVAAQGLQVEADPERLPQVFANLLTNAGKYTENRGDITLSALREGEHIVLRVVDSGVGISADMLPHVFDMFSQEAQSLDRAKGGIGLGLAISRSLTQLHGGSISASSGGRDQGSVFTVRLPAATGVTATAIAHPRLPERANSGLSCPILVVDDNADAAQILSELLTFCGYQVRVAGDGPSALHVVQSFTPRIALLDIGLPIMDGYELAGHLRTQPGLAQLQMVALTGYGQATDRQRSAQAGFVRHLVKPVDIDTLEAVIRELLAPPPA